MQPATGSQERWTMGGLLLRAGLLLFTIAVLNGIVGRILTELIGYFPAAAVSIFLTAAFANWFVVRVFERGRLEDVGMGWSLSSHRHLGLGIVGGMATALIVLLAPLAAGLGTLVKSPDPAEAFSFGKFLYVSVLLLFGAVGEELMFRGYAFQMVLRQAGPWATILPFGVLFAAAHMSNLNTSYLGLVNTGIWGVILGYSFYKSGDLWLPIGLHFGWNWMLPIFGVNLSGFTMNLSGYRIEWKAGSLWSGGAYGPEGSVLTTVAAVALTAWLWRTRFDRQETILLAEDRGSQPG
jgi:hypothetical protein